jgi:hypothetical protein
MVNPVSDCDRAPFRPLYALMPHCSAHSSSTVCQVSEGLDFADGNARAVMVVGIPYPHVKDKKVAGSSVASNTPFVPCKRRSRNIVVL